MKRTFLVMLIALSLQACTAILGDTKFGFESTPNTVDETEVVQSEIAPVYQEGVLISSGYANISAQSSDNPSPLISSHSSSLPSPNIVTDAISSG